MATAEQYAEWIVKNKDKKGSPEFETVAEAYKLARSEAVAPSVTEPQSNASTQNVGDNLARQVGLTARAGIEGLSDTGEFVLNSANKLMSKTPLGLVATAVTDYAGIPQTEFSGSGTEVADMMGLPSPQNKVERNVNTAARFLVPTGAIVKGGNIAAQGAKTATGANIAQSLASRPGMQAAGSIGAGYAGSEAREQGASPMGQFAATVAGGLLAPLSVGAGQAVVKGVRNLFSSPATETAVMSKINQAGITLESLPKDVQKSLVVDVQNAMKTGKNLSPDAMRRLADYKQVGATPMQSNLTLNPADITRERNLAKMSANSKDPAAQQLANLQRDNDIKLISGLNKLGAETADDSITAGNKLIQYLDTKDQAAKSVINKYYSQARDTTGRGAKLDPSTFTNTANNLLDDALLGGKLPADVRNVMNSIAQGKTPFTVDVAEQYKTAIGTLQRSSTDPAERLALSKVRQALDDTPLLEGQGKAAIDAFTKARNANRVYMQIVEKTPALKAVRDGVEPDKFVNTFILGQGNKANVADVKALSSSLGNNAEAVNTVKGQIASYLKSQATGGKADEVANFLPSNYSKALKNIGDDKLKLFFTADDIKMLKAIGRVGSYEKFQPTGSAVNNSNTSAALFTAMLDKVANSPLIRKIPFGGALAADPARDVALAIGSRSALNTPKALTLAKPNVKAPATMPIGAFLGLAASENSGN